VGVLNKGKRTEERRKKNEGKGKARAGLEGRKEDEGG
jgi:hypothetical protein